MTVLASVCSICGDGRYAVVAYCGNHPTCAARCCVQCLAPSGLCVACDQRDASQPHPGYGAGVWSLAELILDGAKVGQRGGT